MSFVVLLVFVFNSVYGKNLGYHHHKHNNNGGYNYEPPEIINNDPPQFGGYQYPIPNPPLFDETTPNPHPPYVNYGPPTLDLPNSNVTLPPIQNDIPDYPGYLPPQATLQPPQYKPPEDDYPNNQYIPPLKDDYPNNQYLPPLKDDYPNNQYLPPTNSYETPSVISSRIQVSNMSCLDSPVGGYFRAFMTLSRSISTLPVVDDAPGDCIIGSGDLYRLELEGDRIKQCGVRFCSNGLNMCVSIRMPTVRGLKLPEDGLMTLRCRPQERVVAHTKQIRMNTQNIVQQARSALSRATIVSGGSQRQFDSQVALFRRVNGAAGRNGGNGAAGRNGGNGAAGRNGENGAPGNGDFTQLVGVGAPVTLGEELMLRAAVREGDGWRFSRLGDVTVHHVSNGGRTVRQRAVTLLDSAGCRDARTRAVCPADPVQPSPLITTFGVRAFMFQGMQSGDEMLMSVRIIACLNYEDCHSKSRSCSESQAVGRSNRLRREINSTTSNYQSYLEFRVVNPGVSTPDIANNDVDIDDDDNSDARDAITPHKSSSFSVAISVVIISSCLVLAAAGGLIISCSRN